MLAGGRISTGPAGAPGGRLCAPALWAGGGARGAVRVGYTFVFRVVVSPFLRQLLHVLLGFPPQVHFRC